MAKFNITHECADNIRQRFFELLRQEDMQSTKITGDLCTNKGYCALGILGLAAGLEFYDSEHTRPPQFVSRHGPIIYTGVHDTYHIGAETASDTYGLADQLFDMTDPRDKHARGSGDPSHSRASFIFNTNDRYNYTFSEMADIFEEKLKLAKLPA